MGIFHNLNFQDVPPAGGGRKPLTCPTDARAVFDRKYYLKIINYLSIPTTNSCVLWRHTSIYTLMS